MEINTLTAVQLQQFINNVDYRQMPVVPISALRALSHINNPRVRVNDVILLMAFEEGTMVGYLGVLADNIYNNKGQEFHSGWLSTLWVSPLMRGKGVANQLLAKAYKAWNEQILVTEFTPEAKRLYDRSGYFNHLRTVDGLRCFMRFNLHEVLPPKNSKYAKYKGVLALADALANVPAAIVQSLSFAGPTGGYIFEPVEQINGTLDKYLASCIKSNAEMRGPREFNWLVNYPWVGQSEATEESARYQFTCVANRFENKRYCIKSSAGDIKGYLHFTLRNNHLKIPYAYFEAEAVPAIVSYIKKLMLREQLNMLTVFHPALVNYLQKHRWPLIYLHPIKRNYIISKKLEERAGDMSRLSIQDGDADCAFT